MESIIKILNEIKPGIDYINQVDMIENNVLNHEDIIKLVYKLNTTYGIQLDPEDVDMKWFKTPETIYKLVWEAQET